ncbi:hypothetical protein [Desertivirga brevis]|uniref:hypothetical protein n=1 Tax=Desertivirga brevis TaxID=2810310 RepID=UPI001A95A980|nr:hypothetical protein [Pedobacter sp. SYSU D00873]
MARKNIPITLKSVCKLLLLNVSFIVLLTACNQSTKDQTKGSSKQKTSVEEISQDENYITCWGIGPLEFGDDPASIQEKVGKENVSMDSLFLEGDFERLITKVWKGSPKEISIVWEEVKAPFKTIKLFEVSHQNSPYKFHNGIGIGSTLKEIVALNGEEPINLYGFGWDYGGTFIDFGKGKLKGDLPCFGGVFELQTEVGDAEVQQAMGNQAITSNLPALKKYPTVLKVIRVSEKGTK